MGIININKTFYSIYDHRYWQCIHHDISRSI